MIKMHTLPSKLTLIICLAVTTSILYAASPYSFIENWKPRNYEKPTQITPRILQTSNNSSATVTVNLSQIINPVLPTQFGVNTTFRNGPDQRSRDNLYQDVVHTLRFPAGSGSNTYFWDGNVPSYTKNYISNTGSESVVSGINALNNNNMTPRIFLDFKNDLNGEPIIVVNYFYARYGTSLSGTRADRVQQAANYAASWVEKMNIEWGGKIKYWEVGNECYGKWEVGYEIADPSTGIVTGKEYGEDFRVFASAMKAVDPTIKIGAVVKDIDDNWNQEVLPEVKDHADFLSVHEYFTTVKDATLVNIFNATAQIQTIKSTLQNCIQKYTGRDKNYYPIALTEFNSRGPYNCSMANGLFISEILGEIVENGYGLASLWVSEWNWNAAENASHSFLSKSDPEQDDYTPRQAYIPFYYYGKCFGDQMIHSSSTNTDIICYASSFSSGEAGLVILNKTSSAKTVKLRITENSENLGLKNIQWYEFYANTIEPSTSGYKKFYINGLTSATSGGGPFPLNQVAPYQSTFNENNILSMPAYSVFYIVADPNRITSLNTDRKRYNTDKITITKDKIVCKTEGFKQIEFIDLQGKLNFKSLRPEVERHNLTSGIFIVKVVYSNEIVISKLTID